MKFSLFFTILFSFTLVCFSCNSKKIPDVSNIKLDLTIERFEQDFFKIDTNNIAKEFDKLNVKYGNFLPDYLFQILGLQPQIDSTIKETKLFLKDSVYNDVYTTATKDFKQMDEVKNELVLALKLHKNYFPKLDVPSKLITFVGPIDGYGCIIPQNNVFAVGLQGFLGKDYEAYSTGYIAQTYPEYKTRRFEKQYIATNCVNVLLNQNFEEKSAGKPLVERFVELGKRMYLVDALLPNTHDSIKTGYTTAQLKSCQKNEAYIWTYFVKGNLLFTREASITNPYVNDGPKTPEINETAPGNIGLFIGWQIVKSYMKKTNKSLQQLMETPANTVFNEAGYAP